MNSASQQHNKENANLLGSLWMITAMALFAIEDAFIKQAALHLPIAQVLILFGVSGALLFAIAIKVDKQNIFIKEVLSPAMRMRFLFEIAGRLFYILAIALIPLSTATVILQATPLVVVAGAVIFFGERVNLTRWIAIFVGLFGVVIIVQPSDEGFSQLSWLAVIGMLGFAGRDLASRLAPAVIGTARLGFYGFIAIILSGLLFSAWDRQDFHLPSIQDTVSITCATLAGCCAYACLMKAMRTGEISAVTPFRYSRLIFGCALGLIFFKNNLRQLCGLEPCSLFYLDCLLVGDLTKANRLNDLTPLFNGFSLTSLRLNLIK